MFENINKKDFLDTPEGLRQRCVRTITSEIKTKITTNEFKQGIKKWKKKTSTSPSGRNLSHYHAQILPNYVEEKQDTSQMFIKIHMSLINLVVERQIILPRWCQVHTILQPKDTGTPKLHRLRPLNIYEDNINLLLRIVLARRLLKQAETQDALADEAWGTRKFRATGDLGLQKVLTMEMRSLTRTSLGQVDLDAKLCYDRMSRHLVAHTCYVYGIPVELCMWFYLLLHGQHHHIITGEGTSPHSYGSKHQSPHQGIGQGSTAALVVWLLISSLLLKSMYGWVRGVTWTDPHKSMSISRKADV